MSPSSTPPPAAGSTVAPSIEVSKHSPSEGNIFGRLFNNLRPPLNRTYTAQAGSIRKSNRPGPHQRRSSSPARSDSREGSVASRSPSGHSGSGGGITPMPASPAFNHPAASASTSALPVLPSNLAESSTSLQSDATSLNDGASAGSGSQGALPQRHYSSVATLGGHSQTHGSNRPVRPQPERRQSSGRRLAAAITRPLFKRSSSQSSVPVESSSVSAPQAQKMLASSTSTSLSTATAHPSNDTRRPSGVVRSRPPSSAGTSGGGGNGSGPPSPAAGGISGLTGNRKLWGSSARSSKAGSIAQTTPSPGTETLHQAPFPSPFFSQSTPTQNFTNPFAPPVDCVLALTKMLSHPIGLTLSQLIPLNLITPSTGFSAHQILGSTLAGASTVSLATTAISEAATVSTSHHTQSSSAQTPASSQWNAPSQHQCPGTLPTSAFVLNEQLAASSLTLPTTSVGTIWRLAKALDWLSEHGNALNAQANHRSNPMTPRPTAASNATAVPSQLGPSGDTSATPGDASAPTETTFDFASLLQSVMDVYASTAAENNIDWVYFHGTRQQIYHTPQAFAQHEGPARWSPDKNNIQDVQEAYVRADERGLGLGLLAVLKQVIDEARPGSSIEVGASFNLTSPPQEGTGVDSDEDEDDVPSEPKGTYFCTIEIVHTFSPTPSPAPLGSQSDASPGHAKKADTLDPIVSASLLQHVHLSLITLPPQSETQVYKVTCVLPQGAAPPPPPGPEPSLRRRKSMDQAREPTMAELTRFIETSLRGKKAALHAQESSTFAKHLSHHLAAWGLDVNFMSTSEDDSEVTSTYESRAKSTLLPSYHLGRLDSGFGGSDSTSPPYPAMASPAIGLAPEPVPTALGAGSSISPPSRSNISESSHAAASVVSPPLDPQLSFIIVDDDIATLKRQLISVRNNAPSVQLHNALLAKRPQLQSRRTRSTQTVQRATHVTVSIIHFTSLTNYRQIKEIVHSILKNASPMFPLPEVLVVPKPVGPRRLLTTLFNAIKRPVLDPYFVPIATSPSSPGGHYFFAGSRPSPAPSHTNANDFDTAAGEALAQQRQMTQNGLSAAISHSTGPRTPPVPGMSTSNPPSPISPDALEYFSKSAAELGSSASQGIIIQSPDGRPTGLFFQPRAASLHEKAESMRASRNSPGDTYASDTSGTSQRSPKVVPHPAYTGQIANGQELPALVIPDHIDLGPTASRMLNLSPGSGSNGEGHPSFGQRAMESLAASQPPVTPATTVVTAPVSDSADQSSPDSRNTEPDASGSPDQDSPQASKVDPQSPRSPAALSPRPPSTRASTSVQSPISPLSTAGLAPGNNDAPLLGTPSPVGSNQPGGDAPTPPLVRRVDRKTSGRGDKVRKLPRRPTGTLVPPINVLIVEDNPINQIILSTFLKRKGIKYSVANNGQEAVDAWKSGDFHLVLMDIQLPVKDGIEATQEIRAMERANHTQGFVSTPSNEANNPITSQPSSAVTSPYELPVIIVALTASSLQSDRVNALAAGCNDFLTKPVSLQWLNQKLVEWGSMAYLSGFSHKRRATLSGQQQQKEGIEQAVAEAQPPPDPAAEKEAMKAKLKAMMSRRPPGLGPKPADKPKETATNAEGDQPKAHESAPGDSLAPPADVQKPTDVAEAEETTPGALQNALASEQASAAANETNVASPVAGNDMGETGPG